MENSVQQKFNFYFFFHKLPQLNFLPKHRLVFVLALACVLSIAGSNNSDNYVFTFDSMTPYCAMSVLAELSFFLMKTNKGQAMNIL